MRSLIVGAALAAHAALAGAQIVDVDIFASFPNTGDVLSGAFTVDAANALFVPAGTVVNAGGQAFATDLYGIQRPEIADFSVFFGDRHLSAGDLSPRTIGPGYEADLWFSPSVLGAARVWFFASNFATTVSFNSGTCGTTCFLGSGASVQLILRGDSPGPSFFTPDSVVTTTSPVPEPESYALLIAGLLFILRRATKPSSPKPASRSA